jgi:release factor H-coupled RctB family protein
MGHSSDVGSRAAVHTFASSKQWIEGDAIRQLNDVAAWPGVTAVAGMPDLHPGKYGPVGCAMLADRIYPAFVGGDIGCGMALSKLDVRARKVRIEEAADRLRVLEGEADLDLTAARERAGLPASAHDGALGTIGGGNHFCELQAIESIALPEVAVAAGLDRDAAYLLVHSGSRGLGFEILQAHLASGLVSLDPDGEAGRAYLAAHDHSVRWAALNRGLIAQRAAMALRADMTGLVDRPHNHAEVRAHGILHRKGAAAADCGLVPIPGSRGTLSYLVEPLVDAPVAALASLAHGAGRRYDRASMQGRAGRHRSDREALARNPFGGRVVCEDRAMLIEESPAAYKSIGLVIDDLVAHGLVRVVATFRPLVTFKKAADPARRDARQAREGEREARRQARRAKEAR